MVVSEATARGIPSIVPTATGAVEAQRGAGRTFPSGDAAALGAVLRRWLHSEEERRHWRDAARAQRALLPAWADTAALVASALWPNRRSD